MTTVQKRLVQAYATLVMAERIQLTDIKDTKVMLEGGTSSSMRAEIEVEVAKRTITVLEDTH